MIDLERIRRARESTPLRDPSRDRVPGSPAFLGRCPAAATGIDIFNLVDPQTIAGDVYQGAPVNPVGLTDRQRAVMMTGPILPGAGDYVVARYVSDRWVAITNTCSGKVCVTVHQCGGGVLPDAEVTITGPDGSVTTGTTGASGVVAVCAPLAYPGTYTATISKSGYQTRTITWEDVPCGGQNQAVTLYPPSFPVSVNVQGCPGCLAGATVDFGPYGSGPLTINPDGSGTASATVPIGADGSVPASVPYTVTTTTPHCVVVNGSGAFTTTGPCDVVDAALVDIDLEDGYICGCCGYPVPKTLHITDSKGGSTTLEWVPPPGGNPFCEANAIPGYVAGVSNLWAGSVTYEESEAGIGVVPPYSDIICCLQQGGSVTKHFLLICNQGAAGEPVIWTLAACAATCPAGSGMPSACDALGPTRTTARLANDDCTSLCTGLVQFCATDTQADCTAPVNLSFELTDSCVSSSPEFIPPEFASSAEVTI